MRQRLGPLRNGRRLGVDANAESSSAARATKAGATDAAVEGVAARHCAAARRYTPATIPRIGEPSSCLDFSARHEAAAPSFSPVCSCSHGRVAQLSRLDHKLWAPSSHFNCCSAAVHLEPAFDRPSRTTRPGIEARPGTSTHAAISRACFRPFVAVDSVVSRDGGTPRGGRVVPSPPSDLHLSPLDG